jgi:NAD(P)-dependent dehydrogenase (short-subunit alcohol dehydrogenase family)
VTIAADLDLTGRCVLVTGAANGFGAAAASLFGEHGASLILADREEEPLREISDRLGAKAIAFDQADIRSIDRLVAEAGPVDILLNIAGILVAKPLLETSIEDVKRLIDIDLLGVIRLTQLVGRGMVERRKGVIVSIGSQTAFSGGEGRAVYASVKAAVSQLTRGAAAEWGQYGVRVVCLAPGRCITRMTTETVQAGRSGDRGLSRVPLGRWGQPEEVAKMILFLASDAASYVTGETLIADGGFVIG